MNTDYKDLIEELLTSSASFNSICLKHGRFAGNVHPYLKRNHPEVLAARQVKFPSKSVPTATLSKEQKNALCMRVLSKQETVKEVCEAEGIPTPTLYAWLARAKGKSIAATSRYEVALKQIAHLEAAVVRLEGVVAQMKRQASGFQPLGADSTIS